MYYYYVHPFVIVIRFEFIPEISYMVGEGVSSVLVSVNITGDSGITPYPITITLTTESGTAIGESWYSHHHIVSGNLRIKEQSTGRKVEFPCVSLHAF